MKKSFVTEAINLKSYPLSDNDSIVVMFSKTKGLIRAVARGAKKPKSKLGARIQMFIANKLMLFEGKNMDTIMEAQSVNTFSKIRYDLDKMSYSMYIVEIINNFCNSEFESSSNSIYDLIFDTFQNISNAKTKKDVVFASLKFQIKIMKELGWGIDFKRCTKCMDKLDSDSSSFFSFEEGSLLCKKCAVDKINGIWINNKIIEFLDTIMDAQINQKTKYDEVVTLNILEKCFDFMKKYINRLTNKKTKVFETIEKTLINAN